MKFLGLWLREFLAIPSTVSQVCLSFFHLLWIVFFIKYLFLPNIPISTFNPGPPGPLALLLCFLPWPRSCTTWWLCPKRPFFLFHSTIFTYGSPSVIHLSKWLQMVIKEFSLNHLVPQNSKHTRRPIGASWEESWRIQSGLEAFITALGILGHLGLHTRLLDTFIFEGAREI